MAFRRGNRSQRLGANIARAMRQKCVSVEGLAYLVFGTTDDVVLSRQREALIESWVAGTAEPTMGELAHMAERLRVTSAELLEGV